ncbi:hypothetical protein [Streptomyces sp. NBC_00467]
MILTDAELDHTLGIARLREADGFDVLDFLPRAGQFAVPCRRACGARPQW